jgi:hypothetical protein
MDFDLGVCGVSFNRLEFAVLDHASFVESRMPHVPQSAFEMFSV